VNLEDLEATTTLEDLVESLSDLEAHAREVAGDVQDDQAQRIMQLAEEINECMKMAAVANLQQAEQDLFQAAATLRFPVSLN